MGFVIDNGECNVLYFDRHSNFHAMDEFICTDAKSIIQTENEVTRINMTASAASSLNHGKKGPGKKGSGKKGPEKRASEKRAPEKRA